MIYALTGTIAAVSSQKIGLQTSGIIFDIAVPHGPVYQIDSQATVYIYFSWNQETGPALFGFQTLFDKEVFELVTSCPGVGPKIGLAVLQDLGADECVHAIASEDARALSRVTGIGAKRAEQVIVQLKHKVGSLLSRASAGTGQQWQVLSQALEALNYSRPEVSQALSYVKSQPEQHTASFDVALRSALAYLSKKTV